MGKGPERLGLKIPLCSKTQVRGTMNKGIVIDPVGRLTALFH